MKMDELADRVERLEGPCTSMDRAIATALPRGDWWDDCMGEPGYEAKRFTESLDAAMTLVPEGAYWSIGNPREGKHDGLFHARIGLVHAGHDLIPLHRASAATPALALTAAALRSRGKA